MKEIKLTRNKITLVDDEDFDRLNQFKWYAHWDNKNFYVVRNNKPENDKWQTVRMHREIMNAIDGEDIDHKNGDTLDNRKENLRICTKQENVFNRKRANKNNKLGVKGVSWHKQHKKFYSCIQINGKRIFLGCFNVLGDADSMYRKAEEKYFGEFARKYQKILKLALIRVINQLIGVMMG